MEARLVKLEGVVADLLSDESSSDVSLIGRVDGVRGARDSPATLYSLQRALATPRSR